MKKYEVIAEGFVTEDGKPAKVGEVVRGNPRNGNTLCGLRFKQLKPTNKDLTFPQEEESPARNEELAGKLSGSEAQLADMQAEKEQLEAAKAEAEKKAEAAEKQLEAAKAEAKGPAAKKAQS